jgi:hypothetical protein
MYLISGWYLKYIEDFYNSKSMIKKKTIHPGLLYMPVIPTLRRLKQEDGEFRGQPGVHSKTLSLKKQQNKQTNKTLTTTIQLKMGKVLV